MSTDADETAAPLGRAVGSNLVLGLINNISLRFGNLLLGVLLARLLVPTEFGVFAVALTIQAVLANLSDLGMTAYLVRSDDIRGRAPTVLAAGASVGVVLTLVMVLTAGPLAHVMGSDASAPVIQVMALTLVLSGIGSVPTAILQRRFQQGRQLAADGTSFIVGGLVTLAFIASGTGAMSLAWGRVAGQLTAVVLLFVFSRYREGISIDRAVAKDAYRFGLPLVGANVLSWLLLNMDYVIVSREFGATALGVYVLAFNIASWPTSAISQALRAVALPAFARVDADEPAVRARNVGAATALTLAAAAPISALLVALASPVVLAVYGGNWRDAAGSLAALGAFGAIRPVFDLLATYLTSRGATKPVFYVQIAHTVALLPALLLGVKVGGLAGAGIAHLIVGVVVVIPAYLVCLHADGLRVPPVLLPSAFPLVAGVGAGLLAFAAGSPFGSPWAAVLIGGAVSSLVYLAVTLGWLRRVFAGLRGSPAEPLAEVVPDTAPSGTPVVAVPLDVWEDPSQPTVTR